MRRTRFVFVGLLLALGATALVIAATGTAAKQAPFKAAWIYVGPHNDGGWSQAHDKGRLAVQKALGSKVQTTYKELVPEGPQTCQVIESLIRDGNKIIFATSFGFQNCMLSRPKSTPTSTSSRRRERYRRRTWPSTSAQVRTRSTSPACLPERRRRRT